MRSTLALLALAFFCSASLQADVSLAPQSFNYSGSKAVFIDFQSAKYMIEFDAKTSTARSISRIEFEQFENGFPLFDLVPEITALRIDGAATAQELLRSPDGKTQYRVLKTELKAGKHVLEIEAAYDKHLQFTANRTLGAVVAAAFFFSDVNTDRNYLEQYLPANLEYDQYPAELSLVFKEFDMKASDQDVFTNGKITKVDADRIQIIFPAFYNSAAFFFQMAPKNRFQATEFVYEGIDKKIPVRIFTKTNDLAKYVEKAKEVLKNLESTFGAWPHETLTIYASGNELAGSGMEYSGATVTNLAALSHELFHSYNARSTMPAGGNAGWMDEAIASWRDKDFPVASGYPATPIRLSSRTSYVRYIDRQPYAYGRQVISAFAGVCKSNGQSFLEFLVGYYKKHRATVVSTDMFQLELEMFMKKGLKAEFEKYIYGGRRPSRRDISPGEPSFHREWSEAELLDLL